MKKILSPQDFFLSSGLYVNYEIESSSINEFLAILRFKGPLDSYCHKCKMDSVFLEKENESSGRVKAKFALVGRTRQRESTNSLNLTQKPEKEESLFENIEIFEKEFSCTRNGEHIMCFTLLLLKNSFQKIGQYPSIYDLNSNTFIEYKKILGTHFKELQSAIRLYSNGVGIGSYVYLRRTVENFVIKPAYENAKFVDGWDEELYQSKKFKGRVVLLKEFLPDFIVENSILYSILSAGIQSLDDEYCLEYFPVLLNCIQNVLFDIKEKEDRVSKRKNLRNSLSMINKNISSKNN